MLKEEDGKLSSRRVLAVLAFIVASAAGIASYNEMMYAFLSFSGASIGATTLQRFPQK